MSFDDQKGIQIAIEEAEKGGALIHEDGTVLGRGHNMRFQKGSPTLHGEISTLENTGRLKGNVYKGCTMYTTLSPCDMCTGAIIMYGIKRVVIGENATFYGGEDYLRQRGVEVVNLDNQHCKDLMTKFITERPADWNEDIGTE
ncbi:hypothetical protein WICMUC_005303 [Wickerhamomyces mucosus]|uniref:Cytosine deaminase n=1 Tax=Wickerhamomyces mucosus TaxID=1378264 RepID=A0A9P8T6F6_9ASCO|nr:hypothetical protein WICMUC_005303 [Wickerhamomyces mucosus]